MGYNRVVRDGVLYIQMPNGGLLKDCSSGGAIDRLRMKIPKGPGIYCLRCTVTGRYYVGSTRNLFLRMNDHYSRIRSGVAIRGLHADLVDGSVEYLVLESGNLSPEALSVLVWHYIQKFDCVYPRGFNKKNPFTGFYLAEVFDYLYSKKRV